MGNAQPLHIGSSSADARKHTRAEIVGDCTLLGAVTLLPVVPFITRLGIYADDWGVLAFLRFHGDRTLVDYLRRFYSLPITHMRPAQVLYEGVLYHQFGAKPFGYHAINAVVFLGSAWLLYLSLRLAVRQRFLALAIPLVFILLPNYSSARFVPFAFMVGLSMVFFFLNLYAMLKATEKTVLGWGWTIVSVVALLISTLAYEVAIPLFALSFVMVWYLERKKPVADRPWISSPVLLSVLNAMALLSVLAFKALTTTRYHGVTTAPGVVLGALGAIPSVLHGAVHVHFHELGLRLPIIALEALLRYWNPMLFVLAVLLGAVVFWYLWRIQLHPGTEGWGNQDALGLTALGFVVFVLGNAMFLVSAGEFSFTMTGVANRTAMAASLGVSMVFVAAAMWVSLLARRQKELISSLLIALLCSGTFLATGTIGAFWAAAADQQRAILSSVQRDVHSLPPNTTLLIDGVCPYIGPGIVFEGPGDMGGALQLLFRDPTLQGDVVTQRMEIETEGIRTKLYYLLRFYPYRPKLKVYNLRSKAVINIPDLTSAQEYFEGMGMAHTTCPVGIEGFGVPIF
jgi:hypothetical protein